MYQVNSVAGWGDRKFILKGNRKTGWPEDANGPGVELEKEHKIWEKQEIIY